MKLWQKVSLTALIFVMLAIQLTQFLVLERSFENSIQRERQTAVAAHEALSASLSNHAAYERLKAGKLLLSTDEIAELLHSTVTADISTAAAIAVQTVRDYIQQTNSSIEVIFNVFKDIDYTIYSRLLQEP